MVTKVQSELIANNAILTQHIDDNQVTGDQLADNITIAGTLTSTGAFTSPGIDDNADANAITIDSSEKVGIGITSPATKLDIVGTDPNDNVNRVVNIADDRAVAADVGGSISFFGKYQGSSYSTYAQIIGAKTNATSGDYSGYLAFKTRSASALPAEAMRIDSSGRVMIGTTTEGRANEGADMFTIGDDGSNNSGMTMRSGTTGYGSIYFSDATTGTGEYAGYIQYSHNTNDMLLATDANTRMMITSGGKILIGDTASHVDDLLQIETPASGGGHGIQIRRNDSNGDQGIGRIMFGNNNDTDLATIQAITDGQADCARLVFSTQPTSGNSTEAMRINSSGQITKAVQPYIRCAGNNASMVTSQGTTSDFSYWADQVQRGITRSGAVFTVPVAGEYLITYSFYNWINNSGKGVTHAVYLYKGSTSIQETTAEYDFEDDNYSYYDNNLSNTLILNMAAGDTFKFVAYADIYGGATHTNMSAYLLG